MPRLPGIGQRNAVRVLEKLGFQIIRQSGHIVMAKDTANFRMIESVRASRNA